MGDWCGSEVPSRTEEKTRDRSETSSKGGVGRPTKAILGARKGIEGIVLPIDGHF
jgi:hypothetical protein